LAASDFTRCGNIPLRANSKFFGCQVAWNMALSPRRATGTQRSSNNFFPGMGVPVRGGRVTKKKDQGRGRAEPKSEMLLKLQLRSNPEALCLVRATVERAAEVMHFQDSDARAIVRSVDEALANVMRHAYRGRPGLPIEMSCHRLPPGETKTAQGGIEILLADKGVPIKLAALKGRPLDEIRPGGLGLHFIRQSMDEVEFSRKKGKNLLRMVKYLSPTSQAAASEGD
jgi:serine/threonine-protein kinase RsbW